MIFFGFALWKSRSSFLRYNRLLLALAIGILTVTAIYLVPLPEEVWSSLKGRELITSVDIKIFGQPLPRTMAIYPNGALNAAFSTFVPLTAFSLAVQLSREERFNLLPVLIGLGLASGVLGLLQSIGDPQGSLYLYDITNNGSAVGLLSNRNHQAILLSTLFPMLAVYAASRAEFAGHVRFRGWYAIFASSFLVPLILITGSRAGLVSSIFAILAAAWLYRRTAVAQKANAKRPAIDWRLPAIGAGVATLVLATLSMSRAVALQRIFISEGSEYSRADFWKPVAHMFSDYFPVGTGPGSFVQAYSVDEPHRLLTFTYLNHAHNDWLEFGLSYGFLAVLLVFLGVVTIVSAIVRVRDCRSRTEQAFAALGLAILAIMFGASVVDYPIRAPLMAALTAVAAVWCLPSHGTSPKNDVPA